MIEISRAYESAGRMVSSDDDLRKNAIATLGRASRTCVMNHALLLAEVNS